MVSQELVGHHLEYRAANTINSKAEINPYPVLQPPVVQMRSAV